MNPVDPLIKKLKETLNVKYVNKSLFEC